MSLDMTALTQPFVALLVGLALGLAAALVAAAVRRRHDSA